MASNTATVVATTLIGAACGLLGGLALGGRANEPARPDIDPGAARPQTQASFDSTGIEARLDEHQRALADVKALVAGLAPPGDRMAVVPDSPESSTSEPAENQERLRAIELELAAIRETIKEQVWIQSPPTIDQIKKAPHTAISSEVDRLCGQYSTDPGAAQASVVGKSYEDILAQFGRPSVFQPTRWWYNPQTEGACGFYLEMVNGYVGGMGFLD